eukprot:TRINITY_DN916_c0_g1_i6.p1 TRINITY_DN916_c0_g1~~TRINITY_DN916_c0_g1_i6.p1  ORF type:complete len:198 (-),score=4.36 TRINITY_DN916_c0_g1_i6:53-646(-)
MPMSNQPLHQSTPPACSSLEFPPWLLQQYRCCLSYKPAHSVNVNIFHFQFSKRIVRSPNKPHSPCSIVHNPLSHNCSLLPLPLPFSPLSLSLTDCILRNQLQLWLQCFNHTLVNLVCQLRNENGTSFGCFDQLCFFHRFCVFFVSTYPASLFRLPLFLFLPSVAITSFSSLQATSPTIPVLDNSANRSMLASTLHSS